MSGNSRHQVIRRLQAALPHGGSLDLTVLASFDVSPQLAARYVKSNGSVPLAHGVYTFPKSPNASPTTYLRFTKGDLTL